LVFTCHAQRVGTTTSELLTTSEAARVLRSSRQHIVDLCDRGELPFIRVGTHRRLRRADVLALLRPAFTRDQLKALWLHRTVAGRLVVDPSGVIAKARVNLARLRRVHPDGMTAHWLDRMNRDQVEHVLRAAAQIAGDPDVLVIGSQSVLGAAPDDALPY
jgi:excisionase family DNA binding protein